MGRPPWPATPRGCADYHTGHGRRRCPSRHADRLARTPHPMTRDDLIATFLAGHGATLADTEPLAQDASFRRYLRLRHPIRAVLMDAPPPEDVRPFLSIATHLRAQGL